MKTAQIRKDLHKLKPCTAHGVLVKNNIIAWLLCYERSVSGKGEINFEMLERACLGLAWLLSHILHIDDKQVTPSQRIFLANAHSACQQLYDEQTAI